MPTSAADKMKMAASIDTGFVLPRTIAVGRLSPLEISHIGGTVFWHQPARSSDVLFLFGAADVDCQAAADLYRSGLAPVVLVTGNQGWNNVAPAEPVAHRARANLIECGVSQSAILVEDISSNTLENVVCGRDVLEHHGVVPRSIAFVCKSHHSGRAKRTLSRWLPGVKLSCVTYDATVDDVTIRAEDWWEDEVSRAITFGEYVRIQHYAARGDIDGLT